MIIRDAATLYHDLYIYVCVSPSSVVLWLERLFFKSKWDDDDDDDGHGHGHGHGYCCLCVPH